MGANDTGKEILKAVALALVSALVRIVADRLFPSRNGNTRPPSG